MQRSIRNALRRPDPNEAYIEIEKTEAYLASAREMSDFIKGLPLGVHDNDALVAALLTHSDEVRRDAFMQGFELGCRLASAFLGERHE